MSFIYVFTSQFKEDIRKIMSLLTDLQTAYQTLSSDVDKLKTDVEAKLAADAAALTAASANTVTQADVDAVNAIATKVAALDTEVNA